MMLRSFRMIFWVGLLVMYHVLLPPCRSRASAFSSRSIVPSSSSADERDNEEDMLRSCYDFVSHEKHFDENDPWFSDTSRLDLIGRLESALGVIRPRRRNLAPTCTLNGDFRPCEASICEDLLREYEQTILHCVQPDGGCTNVFEAIEDRTSTPAKVCYENGYLNGVESIVRIMANTNTYAPCTADGRAAVRQGECTPVLTGNVDECFVRVLFTCKSGSSPSPAPTPTPPFAPSPTPTPAPFAPSPTPTPAPFAPSPTPDNLPCIGLAIPTYATPNPADQDSCYENQHLEEGEKCNLICADGYDGTGGIAYCPTGGTDPVFGTGVGGQYYDGLNCSLSTTECAPFYLDGDHFVPGNFEGHMACDVDADSLVRLNPYDPPCGIVCAPGFEGGNGTLYCPAGAQSGESAEMTADCFPMTCDPLEIPRNATPSHAGCAEGDVLNTFPVESSFCPMTCDLGYRVDDGGVQSTDIVTPFGGLFCDAFSVSHSEREVDRISFKLQTEGQSVDLDTRMCEIILATMGMNVQHVDDPNYPPCIVNTGGTGTVNEGFVSSSTTLECSLTRQCVVISETPFACVENHCAALTSQNPESISPDRIRTRVNVNTASAQEITDGLLGIDLVTAQAIVNGRDPSYRSIQDLVSVGSLTEGEVASIRGNVTVNDVYCTDNMSLSTHLLTSCDLDCASGYHGTGGSVFCEVQSNDGSLPTNDFGANDCEINSCISYAFGPGEGPTEAADTCISSTRLNVSTSCSIRCEPGYTGSPGVVTCPTGAAHNAPPLSNVSCVRQECQAIAFDSMLPVGATPISGCVDGSVLHAGDSCMVGCEPGYRTAPVVNTQFVISCDIDEGAGAVVLNGTSDVQCVENSCAPLVFESGDQGSGLASPCTNGTVLHTRTYPTYCDYVRGIDGVVMRAECASNANDGDSVDTFETSSVVMCEPINTSTLPAGVTTNPLDSDSCVDGMLLNNATQNVCNLVCAGGFNGPPGNLTCDSDAQSGDPPSAHIVCQPNFCAPVGNISTYGLVGKANAAALGVACTSATVLAAGGVDVCGVSCAEGYYLASSSANENLTVSCAETQSNGGHANIPSTACLRGRCDGITSLNAGEAFLSNAVPDACAVGTVLQSGESCRLTCADGYTMTSQADVLACPSSATLDTALERQIRCTRNRCAPYSMPEGVVTTVLQSACPDEDGFELMTGVMCSVRCGPGYSGSMDFVKCPSNALEGDEATSAVNCTRNLCAPLVLSDFVEGDGNASVACEEGRVLTAGVDICHIRCKQGYARSEGSTAVACAANAASGSDASQTLQCVPVDCAEYNFGTGVVADDSVTNVSACTDRERLYAVAEQGTRESSCAVKCESGYLPSSAVVRCPLNATYGTSPLNQLQCHTARCAPLDLDELPTSEGASVYGGCDEDQRLETGATCTLSCKSGYKGLGGTMACASNATEGDNATLASLDCVESFCTNLDIPSRFVEIATPSVQYEGETVQACRRGMDMTAVEMQSPNNFCAVSCAPGYTSPAESQSGVFAVLVAQCKLWGDRTEDVPEIQWPVCTENLCAPLELPLGAMNPRFLLDNFSTPCRSGQRLTTHVLPKCNLACGPGYENGDIGASILSVAGNVTCATNASNGASPTTDFSCERAITRVFTVCGNDTADGQPGCTTRELEEGGKPSIFNCQGDLRSFADGQNVSYPRTEGGDWVEIWNVEGSDGPAFRDTIFFLDVNNALSAKPDWLRKSGLVNSRRCVADTRVDLISFPSSRVPILSCPVPARRTNSGSDPMITLMKVDGYSYADGAFYVDEIEVVDTGLLFGCRLKYARPQVLNITGCDSGCSRMGGDRVTLTGRNFGPTEVLVLIDGQECTESHHVAPIDGGARMTPDLCQPDTESSTHELDLNCHHHVTCKAPKMWTARVDVGIMVVQSNQYSSPLASPKLYYSMCASGSQYDPSDVWNCSSCDPGTFKLLDNSEAVAETATCVACPSGRVSTEFGATECVECGANSIPGTGQYECEPCDPGSSSAPGDNECAECEAMYTIPFVAYGHCEQPLGLFLLACVLIFLVAFGTYRCYRSQMEKKAQVAKLQELCRARHDDIGLLSEAWQISWNEIALTKRLAAGGNGEVYRGTLRNRYDVAVKLMLDSTVDLEMDKEVAFLKRARHPRLVLFLGCGVRPSDDATFLVLEFCEEGTLEDFLKVVPDGAAVGKPKARPRWSTRLQLLADTAEGMAHLHLILHTLHRDLKSPNVLLAREQPGNILRAKVTDFGTATIKDKKSWGIVGVAGEEESPSRRFGRNRSSQKSRRVSYHSDSTAFLAEASRRRSSAMSTNSNSGIRRPSNTKEVLSTLDVLAFEDQGYHDDSHSSYAKLKSTADSTRLPTVSEDGSAYVSPSTSLNSSLSATSAGDQGLSTMTAGMGSLLWMAPELVATLKKQRADYSSAVDVFSFGMICYECLTLGLPWQRDAEAQKFSYLIMDKVLAGRRPKYTNKERDRAPNGFVGLMCLCWSQDPNGRPAFDDIVHIIHDVRTEWESRGIRVRAPGSQTTTSTESKTAEQSNKAKRRHTLDDFVELVRLTMDEEAKDDITAPAALPPPPKI